MRVGPGVGAALDETGPVSAAATPNPVTATMICLTSFGIEDKVQRLSLAVPIALRSPLWFIASIMNYERLP